MIGSYPPALTLVLGALLVPLAPGRLKKAVILLLPVISFVHLLGLDHGQSWRITLFDYRLTIVRIDELSLLFGYLFHIAVLLVA